MIIKKKGQLDQPFLYIFAIVVIAFMLLFGLYYIGKTEIFSKKATYVNFRFDFEGAVARAYNKNEGTILTFSPQSQNKPLSLPKEIKSICFQDLGIKTKVIPDAPEYESFTINNLSPATKDLCISTSSSMQFRLENKIINKQTIIIIDEI